MILNYACVTDIKQFILHVCRPVFEELAGKASIWKKISPQVLQLALNVDSDFVHTTNIIPSFD